MATFTDRVGRSLRGFRRRNLRSRAGATKPGAGTLSPPFARRNTDAASDGSPAWRNWPASRAWSATDRRLFELVADRDWPGPERVLPRLSRSANHGRLWFAVAGAMALADTPRSRRAAARGLASLAVASATVNTLGKQAVRRERPLLEGVPLIRQLHRQPVTTSFPSGHAASAAAFVTGVALESPRWGAAVAPLAAAVAFSRVYTGVHYPSDVLVGAALGVGSAFAVRGIAPTRSQLPSPGRPLADAPAMPEGSGLVLVANSTSGSRLEDSDLFPGTSLLEGNRGEHSESAGQEESAEPLEPPALAVVRSMLPKAEIITCDPKSDDIVGALEDAAQRAAELGGALGVCGGDGTVNAAAVCAKRAGVPLAVLPGGTHNHFAFDLGIEEFADTCRAVQSGDAVAVDLGRFTPQPGAAPGAEEVVRAADADEASGLEAERALRSPVPPEPGPGTAAPVLRPGEPGYFLNTFSLGAYPELVRIRERWAHRIGPWPAGVLAALRVLQTSGPVEAGLGGKERALWLLFAGNCAYKVGMAPVRRHDLADGMLDVRLVKAGRWARTRLFIAALTSAVDRSPLHSTTRLRRLMITDIPPGTHLSYDGEVARAPGRLLLDKEHEALRVYRPLNV
ncbi:bifunctional phosphatase PAP2/diacylglycerol kinase family protein [Streptomyces sp. WMMB 322]|uniref:bifunctional phosphatase PAP2/diacylglycerol kinase family protein n=1 Tax=Streptomyces sp. WMMB 322 TaxID=1286821 RepID=UPI000823DEC2|nr:bifunctional phosphatase PAP2/diacylglycerol kinase family protein [Streptomyces sp. WMMB 322]SCK41490.1 undecaprenyl-diphosphatase [Streptomyces sp. WMMB 322]